jgi:lipoic acid synthetase
MESPKNISNNKPEWLRVKACGTQKYLEVQSLLKQHNLHTICQEANCPNRGECFSHGTATFLILGPHCTRNCRFCSVVHGNPNPVDIDEPFNLARAVEILKLRHAVITSVTRDDLPDGGAGQFARVIKEIRKLPSKVSIEVLVPDFEGREELVDIVLSESPDVFNHNIETVPRFYSEIRPQADYRRSLAVLAMASKRGKAAVKSGLMVGLGESIDELKMVFLDLASIGVEYLTIGQYLAPSKAHYPIFKYHHPDEFSSLAIIAGECGIRHVFSAPLVRSSYHADEQYKR